MSATATLTQTFRLQTAADANRFVIAKDLKGKAWIKGWAHAILRRIIHLFKTRVWITEGRILSLSSEARQEVRRSIQRVLRANKKGWEGRVKAAVQDIEHYAKYFQGTSLETKIANIMLGQFQGIARKAKQAIPLTVAEVTDMHAQWERYEALGYCEKAPARKKIEDLLFNATLKHPDQVKHHFAQMHTEAHLETDPLLKTFGGGTKEFSAHYFLHFAEKSAERYEIEEFISYLRENLSHYQRFDLEHLNSTQTDRLITTETKNLQAQIEKMKPGSHHLILGKWFFKASAPHAIAYVISCQKNGHLRFSVVNAGAGSHQHHKWVEKKVIPYVIRVNVKKRVLEAHVRQLVEFTHNVCQLASPADFYERFLPVLSQQAVESEIAVTPQRSGSCAAKLFPLITRHLDDEGYKKLIYTIKAQSIIHFYELFKDKLATDNVAKHLLKIALQNHAKRAKKLGSTAGLLTKEERVLLEKITKLA